MNKLRLIISALALLAGCSGSGDTSDSSLSGLAKYKGLSDAMADGRELIVYDVRTAEEYAAGHIPGAVNIPYDIISDTIPVKDKDAVIVLYCRSGNRSGIAYRGLEKLGYKNLVDFGGVSGWRGELVTGDSP